MLARQQGGGNDDRNLHPRLNGGKGGAQGDLRLAKAHIAAYQSVHGFAAGHIAQNIGDGALLIFSLRIGKTRGEFLIRTFGYFDDFAAFDFTLCGDLHQRVRHILQAFLHAGFALLPPQPA